MERHNKFAVNVTTNWAETLYPDRQHCTFNNAGGNTITRQRYHDWHAPV
jgi:hypothetical protein